MLPKNRLSYRKMGKYPVILNKTKYEMQQLQCSLNDDLEIEFKSDLKMLLVILKLHQAFVGLL